jgi:hypothetical protein
MRLSVAPLAPLTALASLPTRLRCRVRWLPCRSRYRSTIPHHCTSVSGSTSVPTWAQSCVRSVHMCYNYVEEIDVAHKHTRHHKKWLPSLPSFDDKQKLDSATRWVLRQERHYQRALQLGVKPLEPYASWRAASLFCPEDGRFFRQLFALEQLRREKLVNDQM